MFPAQVPLGRAALACALALLVAAPSWAIGVRGDGSGPAAAPQRHAQLSRAARVARVARVAGADRPAAVRARMAASARTGVRATIARAIAAGHRIARLPYRYGGGHGSFEDSAYDCSGSVSYVLHAIGRLDAPMDSTDLMGYGEPGEGDHVTVYANPSHAYMVIDGRRFDTSGRGATGTRWQPDARSTAGYVVRHPPGL